MLVLSVVVIALLVMTFRGIGNVHWADVWNALRHMGPGVIVGTTVLVCLQNLLLVTRLWLLFPRAGGPSWLRVTYGFCMGQFSNNFFPARAGDVLKVLLIAGSGDEGAATSSAVGVTETAGVLVVDKLVDITVLVVLTAIVGLGPLVPPSFSKLPLVLGLASGAVVLGFLAWRVRFFRRLLIGLAVLRSPMRLILCCALTIGGWCCEIFALRILTGNLERVLSFADGVRVLVLLNLGVAFPLSVANVGTFEATIAVGMRAAGAPLADGLAVGTAYHVEQIAGIALWAGAMLALRRVYPLAFGRMAHATAERRPAGS